MKPLRVTDGYVEVAAFPRNAMVEMYVTEPGSEEVYPFHMSAKIAVRLAIWCIKYWIFARWCGLKDRLDLRKAKSQLNQLPDVEYADS
jgi:hypothetical protein